MSKLPTIKQNKDFRRLYHKNSKVTPLFVLYICENHLSYNRIGITTGKKIGKAHDRNRARRVIREGFRYISKFLDSKKHYDFVFVARTKTTICKTPDVIIEMKKALKEYIIES